MGVLKWVVVALCIGAFFILARALFLGNYPDFSIYQHAVRVWFVGENPYQMLHPTQVPYLYPPFMLLFLIPFGILPLEYAAISWTLCSIILLLLSLWLLYRVAHMPLFDVRTLFLTLCIFLSFPIKFTLGMGQANMLILFFISLFFYFLSAKKDIPAGAFLGLSLLCKLFPAAFIPYLFLQKKWVLLGTSSIVFFIGTVSFLFFHMSIEIHFLTRILPGLLESQPSDYYNQAVSGFLLRMTDDASLQILLKSIFIVCISLTTVILFLLGYIQRRTNMLLELSLVLIVSVMLQTFSWQHHFIFLVPTYIFFVSHMIKTKQSYLWYLLLFLSYVAVSGNYAHPEVLSAWITSHVFYGSVLVWFIGMRLLKQIYV